MRRVQTFHPIESEGDKTVLELTTRSSKRDAEVELDHKVEEVYVEALQVKYPIIDWEVYSEDTRRYWRIIKVGNHTEAYQIFANILKKFNRDDQVKLWDLVKERDDTLWKLQRERLYNVKRSSDVDVG
ncbi:hypothetical protein Tco_1259252 [Tanacetum coccineum]